MQVEQWERSDDVTIGFGALRSRFGIDSEFPRKAGNHTNADELPQHENVMTSEGSLESLKLRSL
jgi:hypothetical protein